MNTPGISIFQGGESLQVNKSYDRAAEEEDLEDQRRRHEELGNLLQNAFDDLEEDDTTIDSINNFQSEVLRDEQPLEHRIHGRPNSNDEHTNCEIELHRLKMLVESRTRELDHAKQLLNEEYKKRDEMQKRLSITEAELDRALASKNNNHELLVESKEKCSNLENTINKLRSERKTLESENNALLGKLETAQTLLSDVQCKYDMVERDLNKNSERNLTLKCKQMEDRHRAELDILQQRIEQLADKLDKKTSDLEQMNTRYEALQRSHESMLCDKASKINDLSHALSEAQKRCEDLLSRPDYKQENMRLQKLVASLQEQIAGMEKTINTLKSSLDQTTAELDAMDSVLHQHNMEHSPHKFSQSQGHVVGSTPLRTTDRLGHLKDELYRALANVKNKREDIRKLQRSLDDKQSEINSLREEENKQLVQITTLRDENIRLENRIKILQEEYNASEKTYPETNNEAENLKRELEDLRDQHTHLQAEKQQLEQERAQHETETKRLENQLKNMEIDLDELRQEHDSLKLNYEQVVKENASLQPRQTADKLLLELEKHKFLLKDSQAECDRLKKLYVDVSNAKEALHFEMQKLLKSDQVKELQAEREKVANLQRALNLTEVKASELSKILETEKLYHEREVASLKERFEKQRVVENAKAYKDSANECSKCLDYVSELTKFEIQILKLNNINATSKQEIDDLTEELKTSKHHMAELNAQLKVSEQQEKLIKELKTKAAKFEEYIKSHSSSSELSSSPTKKATSPPAHQLSNKSVSTSPELEKREIRKAEARVRDEMAKIFAAELKLFQMKLQESQEKNRLMQREYHIVTAELQQRQKEVELLKEAILAEREKMEEILSNKDDRCKEVIDKQNVILQKLREELETKKQNIKSMRKELEERQKQIEAERKSMKAVMVQWEEQRKNVDDVENEWKEKFNQLQKGHTVVLQDWKNRYLSAKQTALNYKRYSDDKEAHMLKEYDRLKYEYNLKLTKMLSKENRQTHKSSVDSLGVDKQRILMSNNDQNNNKENESEK